MNLNKIIETNDIIQLAEYVLDINKDIKMRREVQISMVRLLNDVYMKWGTFSEKDRQTIKIACYGF